MSIEHFQALEEKINQMLTRLAKLKDENNELAQANRKLEEKVQTLMADSEKLREQNRVLKEENRTISEKAQKAGEGQAQADQIKNRLEDLLSKIDKVVEA
jgi:FtsZ-binding cell division protein ZapB